MALPRHEDSPTLDDRYRFLFENSREPILIIENGEFVDCNQAALDRLRLDNADDLRTMHPADISPEFQPNGQRSEDKANSILARAREEPYQCFEWLHVDANGEPFQVEVALTAIATDRGTTLHATWRDTSERKRLEQELRHAQKMEAVGQFASAVAHDFNNLLVPILGYTDLLADELQDNEELSSWVLEIRRAATFSVTLINKLLAQSRRNAGALQISDANAAIEGMLELLNRFVGDDVRIRFEPAETPLWVRTGSGDIEQILLNLIANARDALPHGGDVQINLSSAETTGRKIARIEVSDDGVGMDDETLNRLFEPFFTTKKTGRGTGLGMSTVHTIVADAGGTIRARSAPRCGTTVEILLPVAADDEVAAALDGAENDAVETGPESERIEDASVLVIDDDEHVTEMMCRLLQREGYTVSTAHDGDSALQLMADALPDLVITDVQMHGMSGPDIAGEMAARGFDMPVVFMTGHLTEDVTRTGRHTPVFVLKKPFARANMLKTVREALEHARR